MTPLYEIVLVAVMIVQSPLGGPLTLEYQPLDYYNSLNTCRQEQKRLSQKQDKRTGYMCVKVDRN